MAGYNSPVERFPLTDTELLENESATKLSIAGFEQFGQKTRAETLKAEWQKQKASAGK